MDSFNRTSFSQSYAPSAPTLPDSYAQDPLSPPTYNPHPQPQTSSYLQSTRTHTPPRYNGYQSYSSHQQQQQHQHQQPSYAQPPSGYPQTSSNYGYSSSSYSAPPPPPPPNYSGYFPPGTHPEIIQSFQMVDKDRSGFIDERELQEALSFGYHKFSLGTVQLLMFLFRNPLESAKIGPNEFSALWKCLGEWRAIFERFDRDRSGKIDTMELRDALYSLGYAIPPSVLQVLISRYEDGSGRRGNLSFDNFVECGMIVKGLTEKFKEKDPRYTGSATLNYETFMSMVIPFIVT